MNNIRIFEVGGSIRNELIGIPASDRDFSILAPDYESMRQYLLEQGATIFQERPQFVAIRAKLPGVGAVDFTLARKESFYTDGRHPDSVSPAKYIEEDLRRRDFSMNAIARELNTTILIDPFNGQNDIQNKRIVAVGSAEDRFREDTLRIIRAIRFSCQLGFEISKEIYDTILRFTVKDFKNVSSDRLQVELAKTFSSNTSTALQYFRMFPHLIPLFTDRKLWLKPTLEAK
jgi:tRNA nucleotidyltransferase (CCA-adding enzyme)